MREEMREKREKEKLFISSAVRLRTPITLLREGVADVLSQPALIGWHFSKVYICYLLHANEREKILCNINRVRGFEFCFFLLLLSKFSSNFFMLANKKIFFLLRTKSRMCLCVRESYSVIDIEV